MTNNDVTGLLIEASGLRRGADHAITVLKDAGVQVLFGLPADSINSLFDAARRQAMPIITCRHEGSGSLMAAAYGKLTLRPAAVTATNGPGVTHLAVGARDAWLDRSPLVVLPGTVDNDQAGMQSFQDVSTDRFIANWCTQTMRSDTAAAINRLDHLVARARESNSPVAMAISPTTLAAPVLSSCPSPGQPVAAATKWETLPEPANRARDLLTSHPVQVLVADARGLPAGLLDWAWSLGSCLPEALQCPGWGRASDHQWSLPDLASLAPETTILILGSVSQELIRDLAAAHPVVHVTAIPALIPPLDGYLNVTSGAWLDATIGQITCVAADPSTPQLDHDIRLDAVVPDTAVLSVEPSLCATVFPHLLSERHRLITSSFAAHTRGYAVAGALAARVAFPGRPALAITDLAGWRTSGMEWASAVKHGLQFAVLLLCRQGSRDLQQGHAELTAMGLTAHDPTAGIPLMPGEFLTVEVDAARWRAEPRHLHARIGKETRQWINPEQGAMAAIGAAKATSTPAHLEIDDESTLIACLNALYDASFDHTPCIVHVPCAGNGAPFGLDLPDLAAASLPPAADDRALIQLSQSLGGVVIVSTGPAEARPQGLATASHTVQPAPHQTTMDVICGVVQDSHRLVILAGGGGNNSTVGRLAQHLGCPVVATMAAAYAHTVTGFNGYVGSSGSRSANALLRQADTVIALGVSHRGGAFDLFSPTSTVIDVNTDRSALSSRRTHGHRLQSDIGLFIDALIEGTPHSATHRQAAFVQPTRTRPRPHLAGALRTSYVIDTAFRILSPDAGYSYTGDVGLNTLWLFRFGHDHRTTLWSRNFATMGFSLPAALGAAHATGRRHVAVIGDGGAAMAAPALHELSQMSGETLCLVLDNQGLGAVRYEQEFNGWPEHQSGFWNPDFVAIARATGWAASRVDTAEHLQEALQGFRTHGGRLLLHVQCSPDEAPVPATATRPLRLARFLVGWTKEGQAGFRSARTTALEVLRASRQKG